MLDDVLPTEARDEVTALRFTCIHCHSAREFSWGRLWAAKLVETGWLSPKSREGLMDGLEGGEADGRRRRQQAARPTTGEQAHRQKHGRTERWTDKRKLK